MSINFVVTVDVTPHSSRFEQTTFLYRYLSLKDDRYEIQERFLVFADCSSKRGEDIVQLIRMPLKSTPFV